LRDQFALNARKRAEPHPIVGHLHLRNRGKKRLP